MTENEIYRFFYQQVSNNFKDFLTSLLMFFNDSITLSKHIVHTIIQKFVMLYSYLWCLVIYATI